MLKSLEVCGHLHVQLNAEPFVTMGISYRIVSHCEKRKVVITQLWSLQLHLSGLLCVEIKG